MSMSLSTDALVSHTSNQTGHTKIHRIFYTDCDKSSNDERFEIAADSKGLSDTAQALALLNHQHVDFCGIYGDQNAVREQLFILFPHNRTVIEGCFQGDTCLPTVYTIHNDQRMIFALVNCDYTPEVYNEKLWICIIVLQRFLQDICPNIVICPSESFIANFTDKHSFHGRPHRPRTYHQREATHQDITMAEQIHVEGQEYLRTLCDKHCRTGLRTNIGRHTFFYHKTTEENVDTKEKIVRLKQHLLKTINLENINIRFIINICRQSHIQVSQNQQNRINELINNTVGFYEINTAGVDATAKSLVKDLLVEKHNYILKSSYIVDLSKEKREVLYALIKQWLINPINRDQSALDFTNEIVAIILKIRPSNQSKGVISQDRAILFRKKLEEHDKKAHVMGLVEDLAEAICLALQSENAFEVHFHLHQLSYVPLEAGKTISALQVNHIKTTDLSFTSFAELMKISSLNENDRRIFSDRMQFVACFKTYDDTSELLIIRTPKINNNKVNEEHYVHKILSVKNGHLRLITEYTLDNVSITFAFNASSQTIIMYNINNNNVNKCVLNSLGQKENTHSLKADGSRKFSKGIKSMTLTVHQALLIIIDGESNVYSVDVTNSDTTSINLLKKSKKGDEYEENFVADECELYECVQTIGERNPIFFFQSKSYVDIIDENYHQLQSIKFDKHSIYYQMQIFTDLTTTFCVLFDDEQHQVYAVQNLVLDSRIEREESADGPDKLVKASYIGNRLLDVIKMGEIQFGPTVNIEKTKYHLCFPSSMISNMNRIYQYFNKLSLHAELQINDNIPFENFSLRDSDEVHHRIYGRVPLQLSTIDSGCFIPLNEGRRDIVEDLAPEFFSVDRKTMEISFAYLEEILNTIDHNLLVIGVIGRQSTGKSYLMNRLFGTRFAVAAGRCTDGIWISYAVCDNQRYVILDCEGLFSEQRTEDEEVKLLAFLAAMCDVTILSQDLGFSRYQDRLFSLLAESVKKIKVTDKLFQGFLLVAVRDISDSSAEEAIDAAEQKFTNLSKKGNSQFLAQLFSKKFSIQPLHHYENTNFQHEIVLLREKFAELRESKRWNNGKEVCDRMKILLVQLYLDDFSDSNNIQTQMNFSKLKDYATTLWLHGDLKDEKIQSLSKSFQGTQYTLNFDHTKLQLNDKSMENNYVQLCEFLSESASIHVTTPEEQNRLLKFLDSFTTEIFHHRRKEVRKLLRQKFNKFFPKENESLAEKLTTFFEETDQYMHSFQLGMCPKTCPKCNLSCVRRSEHAETSKKLLEETKQQLKDLESAVDNKRSVEDAEVRADLIRKAVEKENDISRKKNRLEAQRNFLHEKDELDRQISYLQKSIIYEKGVTETIEKKMKELMPADNAIENIDQLIQTEIKLLSNPEYFQYDEQQKLMKEFYDEHTELEFSLTKCNTDDSQKNELNQWIHLMNDYVNRLNDKCSDVQSKLEEIQKHVAEERDQSDEMLNDIRQLDSEMEQMNKKHNESKRAAEEVKKCQADLQHQKATLVIEKNQLEKNIGKENAVNLSNQQKIEKYIDRLQTVLLDDENHRIELEQTRDLLNNLKSIEEHIALAETSLIKLKYQKSQREKIIEDYEEGDSDVEDDKNALMKINRKIEETERNLVDQIQKKSTAYDENELLRTILTQPTTIFTEETRLEEIHKQINHLDEEILQKSNEHLLYVTDYGEYAARMQSLNCDVEKKRTEQKNRDEKIKSQIEKSTLGTVLYESLSKLKATLSNSSKKLGQLNEAKQLSDSYKSSSKILNTKESEVSIFKKKYDQLLNNHAQSSDDAVEHENLSLNDCELLLENITKNYENIQAEVKRLHDLDGTIIRFSQLNNQVSHLEREVQLDCDCGTNHKCSDQCQICPKEGQADVKPCMFCAGHLGEHKCVAGHVCQSLCQICQFRGDEPNRCHFPYNHQDPLDHQCERDHPCPRTCEICSEPCSTLVDLKGHHQHRCSSRVCWKHCMFGTCSNRCTVQDHCHDATAEEVYFSRGGKKVSMKKHLCDQKHTCLEICDTPGICKFEYINHKRTWVSESNEEFSYTYIEVKESRGNCEILIDASLYSHDATSPKHRCKAEHTCKERCPDCDAFCQEPHGHQGYHRTVHRNKDQHVFTGINPTESIEIQVGESSETIVRRYKVGESAQPENCSVSCKRRGRSHFHLVECPGGDNCYQKNLPTKARHSNEVYYYDAAKSSPKQYDTILCSTYWSLMKWIPPVNDADRTLIDMCNFFCNEHARMHQGNIIKDSLRGFCSLDAWHTGSHTFECDDEHQTKESYEGIDVCFVIDTTGSMGKYIELVKTTISRIIEENEKQLKAINANSAFQFAIVDYRDHEPEADYVFKFCDFTNHRAAIAYVNTLTADSGGDTPEAVLDGLDAACNLKKWRGKADHLLFHILDAPPHGKAYYSGSDRWPEGCPCKMTASNVLIKMTEKKIAYNVLMCNSSLNKMITDFEKYIMVRKLTFDSNIDFKEIITKRVHQQLVDTEMTMKKLA